jgi:hypothetical protein
LSELTEKRVVLEVPGMDTVTVRRDLRYETRGRHFAVDVYEPSGAAASPAVVFVSGYPDPGFKKVFGCTFREMGAYVSWAQLVACSGMVGITYENEHPREDARAVLRFVTANAAALGIDPRHVAVWACSGNAPTGLSLLADPTIEVSRGVLLYGYLMDVDGHTEVADAAAQFGFADAMSGVPRSGSARRSAAAGPRRPGCDAGPQRIGRPVRCARVGGKPASDRDQPSGGCACVRPR